MRDEIPLHKHLRAWLLALPESDLPTTYREAANAMQLRPPGTIRQGAGALESMMWEDVETNHPLIASLVVSRRGDLPRPGFFEKAVALGRFPENPTRHDAAYRQEFDQALALRATMQTQRWP